MFFFKLEFKTKRWITTALQKSVSLKDKLFSDFINKKVLTLKTELHIKYKSYRNMLSTLMKKSKQNYFTKFLENNLKNLKNTWKGIKSIISVKTLLQILQHYSLIKMKTLIIQKE